MFTSFILKELPTDETTMEHKLFIENHVYKKNIGPSGNQFY